MKHKKYDHKKIEAKWQETWLKDKIYEPNLSESENPYYNLMMFPYPSAEGLHVGNMYAFTGSDVYGRHMRMQGNDVFEPIGLDGFGIHSENFALKTNTHPMKLAEKSEKNFYRQLQLLGNGFSWNEHLETYDPKYYRWTQWIFVKMFEHGLAYRKKAPVNWCPSCKTVLADEQVIAGHCERCDHKVIKKELAQWFFRITNYAEDLLKSLETIDWSEKVKIAQRNWIGRSEGAEINFELKTKNNYVLIHGYKGSPKTNFFPWLKRELERIGNSAHVLELPNPDEPNIQEQVDYVIKNAKFDEDTVLLGHSLGSVVALKVAEQLNVKIKKLIFAAGFCSPQFLNEKRPFEDTFNWKFNFDRIKNNVREIVTIRDIGDKIVPPERSEELKKHLGGTLIDIAAQDMHICGKEEPSMLYACTDKIKIFTTRPDTLFGATYMVLGPEHPYINALKNQIENYAEINAYVAAALEKSEKDRTGEDEEKTGVPLRGIFATNPATKKPIQVWVADYVLGNVGTGAIMAVPAHDARDFAFARTFDLPIQQVIKPESDKKYDAKSAYTGEGTLVHSGKFNETKTSSARYEITMDVGGQKQVRYRLRDWLISRQRYWGPPIPLIYCENCFKNPPEQETLNHGERENPGWSAVREQDLPVELPYIKDFRPKGEGKSPLAKEKSFYEVSCPKCGKAGERETDVSDTFLDSAWYYFRYIDTQNEMEPFDEARARKWLPVDMYIGGAEHSVLHLLYTRFITRVFHELKLIDFTEPFTRFRAHGLIIKEGAKMSKSKGNVVNPDEYIKEFGADALRMYLMFLGPFAQGGDFQERGILGVTRFLDRVWSCAHKISETQNDETENAAHKAIQKVTADIEDLRYNTAISALMILLNEFDRHESVPQASFEILLQLLAPFAPHITEEIWRDVLKNKKSVHVSSWPKHDPDLVADDTYNLVIQTNGKVRDTIEIPRGATQEEAETAVAKSENAQRHLANTKIKKIIFVKDRLINFVV